jgi:EAL domain-containing protein (putative c-di-GMP-specific phosphodiesterase class I)
VAEGVETASQRKRLLALDCDYAQGHYYSCAVDSATASALLALDRREAGEAIEAATASGTASQAWTRSQ